MNKCDAIILAGGSGTRMNTTTPKQFLLLNNKPILYYSIEKFIKCDLIEKIFLVMHRDYLYRCKKIIRNFNSKHIQIIEGGAERFISVSNALKFVNSEFVCIHDGVRPFVTEKLIVNTIIETTKANNAGCICCIDIKDTIKVVDKEKFFINNTIDRNKMFAAQTPQTFRSVLIKKAYKLACKDLFYGTDDASFLERYGYKVKFIYGDCFNIKITTPDDIIFARIYLESLKLK